MTLSTACKASKYFDNLSPTGLSREEHMDTVGSNLSADSTGRNTTSVEGILTLGALRGREAGLEAGAAQTFGVPPRAVWNSGQC